MYRQAIQELINEQRNLTVIESSVEDVIIEQEEVRPILTDKGEVIVADRLVLTTGTFLGGVMHTGLEQKPGGRVGDPSSIKLAERLRKLPLPVGRLKTGNAAKATQRHHRLVEALSSTRRSAHTPFVLRFQQPGQTKTGRVLHDQDKQRDAQNNKGLFRQVSNVFWHH